MDKVSNGGSTCTSLHTPLHLRFEDLTVKVNDKYVLQNVSGEVKPGELVAIMGPSGAGKSTLLNVLTGKFNGMTLESGNITLNNQNANKQLRRRIGYVMQQDVFFSYLTVQQTLEFAGQILLPDSASKCKKAEIVNNVIDQLNLKKCLDTVLGGGIFSSGCSGGEKKRCSIAVELIKNPSLLILDEPTSGLDAATACSLTKNIKNLAEKQNRAVLVTIHQPSSHVFHMFDKLLLLCNGKVAYFGKTNGVLKFFEYIHMPCYPNWNPADFVSEKLTDGEEVEEIIVSNFKKWKRTPDAKLYCEEPEKCFTNGKPIMGHSPYEDDVKMGSLSNENTPSVYCKPDVSMTSSCNGDADADMRRTASNTDVCMNLLSTPAELVPDVELTTDVPKWPTCFQTQFIALCKRAFIQTRDNVCDRFNIIQSISLALSCSLIWFNTPYDEISIEDRKGVIFFLMTYLVLNPMFIAVLTFGPEKEAISKERSCGMYRLSAYLLAKNISEIPLLLITPFILYSITYWATGLNRSPVFLIGLFLVMTICFLAQSIGYCVGVAIQQLKKCLCICVILAMTAMLMGGFYTRRMPKWLRWGRYVSHISHAFNIHHRLEFLYATRTFRCNAPYSPFKVCANNGSMVIHGSDIQEEYGNLDLSIYESFAYLWGCIIFFRILFYIILRFFSKPK